MGHQRRLRRLRKDVRDREQEAIPTPERSEASKLVASMWCAAFIDLLGYRSILESMDVPIEPNASERTALEAGFAKSMRLRRRLLGMLDGFMKSYSDMPPPEALLKLPLQAQRLAASWRQIKTIQSPGPDHVVLACSLN